jgi:hypothetical protein
MFPNKTEKNTGGRGELVSMLQVAVNDSCVVVKFYLCKEVKRMFAVVS